MSATEHFDKMEAATAAMRNETRTVPTEEARLARQALLGSLAVQAGSLPVPSAYLFELFNRWTIRASQARVEVAYHESNRDSRRAADWRLRSLMWDMAAVELDRQLEAAGIPRPEENNVSQPTPAGRGSNQGENQNEERR